MFIYSKPNALQKNICREVINTFENDPEKHTGFVRDSEGNLSNNSNSVKRSMDLTFTPEMLNHPSWGGLLQVVVNTVYIGIKDYYNRFQDLLSLPQLDICDSFNLQRYLPNEGFYIYHAENTSRVNLHRAFVWMIYLNDVTEGGETEFLYQRRFERPEEGKLLIWPADWTHLHRGIPSETQTKYIITGWLQFKYN